MWLEKARWERSVCVCLCIYSMHVCIYRRTHVCMHLHVSCMYASTHVLTQRIHILSSVASLPLQFHVCMHLHTYSHTHLHTYSRRIKHWLSSTASLTHRCLHCWNATTAAEDVLEVLMLTLTLTLFIQPKNLKCHAIFIHPAKELIQQQARTCLKCSHSCSC